ncbi:DUF4228 domain protein [Tasmannia lanceolata]|uniref:DUF4228 domain protein n=1 Tax=Tasmannia lanceolata TaxID=3420 RepID=UPI00406281D1
MGNCQAAEAATVVILRPGGIINRIYWSVSANEIMNSNPGHYVAVVTASVSENGTPIKHLKLLRPDDTLHIGHVYRLISFEEVLKEFSGKKYAKLSRLLSMQRQQQKGYGKEKKEGAGGSKNDSDGKSVKVEEQDACRVGKNGGLAKSRQWRPALQSISEFGN